MTKEKALINFKKTSSLLEKIIKMTENGDYCIDIMQQNLAAIGMLRSAHAMLMEGHLNSCFKAGIKSKNAKTIDKMTSEVLNVVKMFNK